MLDNQKMAVSELVDAVKALFSYLLNQSTLEE